MGEIKREHRTALFVDVTNGDSGFVERAGRLVESLNGPNIKTDIYTVRNGVVTRGWNPASSAAAAEQDLVALGKAHGYVQVLVSTPGA